MANEIIKFKASVVTARGKTVASGDATVTVIDTSRTVVNPMEFITNGALLIASPRIFEVRDKDSGEIFTAKNRIVGGEISDVASSPQARYILELPSRSGNWELYNPASETAIGALYFEGYVSEVKTWYGYGVDNTALMAVNLEAIKPWLRAVGVTVMFNSPTLWKVPDHLHPSFVAIGGMFCNTKVFNQNLNSWDTTQITRMSGTFNGAAAYNQPLTGWNVINLIEAELMFANTDSFNGSLEGWRTPNLTVTSFMFYKAVRFNRPLNHLDTTRVIRMQSMFDGASSFNQTLEDWVVKEVGIMTDMFNGATRFSYPLNMWCVSKIYWLPSGFNLNAPLLVGNNLPVWGTCPGKVDTTTTPNGTYHWQNPIANFILGGTVTKYLEIHEACAIGADSDWDSAPSGLTGIYLLKDASLEVAWGIWGGGYGSSVRPYNHSIMFTSYDWANYDRNWGTTSDTAIDWFGYCDWGDGFFASKTGITKTWGGITMTIMAETTVKKNGAQRRKTTIKLYNANTKPIYFKTLWGCEATSDGVYAHGDNGSTFFGAGTFQPEPKKPRNFSEVFDGYIIVKDSV